MRHIGRLLRHGWRAVTEAHTALWVIEMIVSPATAAGIVTAVLARLGEHSIAVLGSFFVLAFGVVALVTLAWLGHRRETKWNNTNVPLGNEAEWTAANLFFHICPDLERDSENPDLRKQTGADVLDALASGKIRMRGRLIDDSRRLPLTWIEEGFWPKAKFTFWFLDPDDNQSLRVRNDATGAGYTDLRVDRTAALGVWPLPIPLRDAARIAYERTRGTPSALAAERFGGTPEGILDHLEGALFLYHRVLAQRSPSTVYEEIPMYLRPQLKVFPNGNGFGYHADKQPIYVNPRIHLADLEAYIRGATEPEMPEWPLQERAPGT